MAWDELGGEGGGHKLPELKIAGNAKIETLQRYRLMAAQAASKSDRLPSWSVSGTTSCI
jgi:hypothetical protein